MTVASAPQPSSNSSGWRAYDLDHKAQSLVIAHRDRSGALTESHKMRMAVAYGLERFWGEHLRYESSQKTEDQNKGAYWKAVWVELANILQDAGISLPDGTGRITHANTSGIKATAQAIWAMDADDRDDQQIALMVLTQFCDALVWWTQRYKTKK
jgi:hypothetical protein